MESMDRIRRVGGWGWVAGGLLLELVAMARGAEPLGLVTWLLVGVTVVLAGLSAVHAQSRTTIAAGWLAACFIAADLAGAVLDRFGALGAPGEPHVSWGSWPAFRDYTAQLLHRPATGVVTAAAVAATLVEVVLAALLVTGWQRRWIGKATAGLFVVYTLALAASVHLADVHIYAMPVLIGAALLVSATPSRRERGSPAQTRGVGAVKERSRA